MDNHYFNKKYIKNEKILLFFQFNNVIGFSLLNHKYLTNARLLDYELQKENN